jgi:hypothetical protein
VLASATFATHSYGQTAEALMEVLVRKGILTEQEAEDIKADLARENRQHIKALVPGKETSALNISGDFRGRFEGFYSGNDAFLDRNRFRYRLRVGAVATFREAFEVGFRLSSSERADNFGGDPISGNTTFQDNGSKKFVFIDLAYGKWTFLNPNNPHQSSHWLGNITLGKMELPWVMPDIVFDPDYTPEGAAIQLSYATGDHRLPGGHQFKLNLGGFYLDELSASSDEPYLLGAQLRWDTLWTDPLKWPQIQTSFGVAGLAISKEDALINGNVPNVNTGNEREASNQFSPVPPGAAGGALNNAYNPIVVDASLTYTLEKFPLYTGNFPIRIGGEYVYNPGADDRNKGFAGGISFGKAGKKGSWDLSYRYMYIGGDSWYEELTQSDFGAFYQQQLPNAGFNTGTNPLGAGYRAGTNVRGHMARASYSPFDALTFNLTWWYTSLISDPVPGGSDSEISRVQVDAVWKF